MTPEQSRAARAWLNWSQNDLADRASVSISCVSSFEVGRHIPQHETLTAMRTALEQGGVRFVVADGLALGIIRADAGIWRFYRSASEVSLADVEAVKLPLILNGRRLYQNSKRALIIKAIIALLKKKCWAQKRLILETLIDLEIEITSPVLSVILREAKELFYNCRRGGIAGWSMSDCFDLDKVTMKSDDHHLRVNRRCNRPVDLA